MDIRQLRYFKAVVDEGTVRAAANALHVSQPALSVSIRKLEDDLGIKLLARVGRRVEPTREGYRFYSHARTILAQSEQAAAEMRAMSGLEGAEIKLAAPGMIANHVLAPALSGYLASHTNVRLIFRQLSGHEVESAILHGEVDIGFTTHLMGDDIVQQPLFTEKAVACVQSSHPLANRDSISWAELMDMPIATLPRAYLINEKLQQEARKHRKSPNIVLETDVMGLLASTVKQGTATGLLIGSAAPEGLKAIPISGPEQKPFTIYGCWRRDAPRSHATETLLAFLGTQNKARASMGG